MGSKRIICLLTYLLLLFLYPISNTTILHAQEAEIVWTQYYGGPGDDKASHMVSTDDGGFIIVGSRVIRTPYDSIFDHTYIYAFKIDSLGDTLWGYGYGSGLMGIGKSITKYIGGSYYILGEENWHGSLVRIDSLGNQIYYIDQGIPVGDFIQMSNDTNLLIVAPSGITKCDSLGTTLWTKSYDNVSLSIVKENYKRESIVAGSKSIPFNHTDMFISKIDSIGNIVWSKTLGDSSLYLQDIGYAIKPTLDGNIIISGITYYGSGNGDVYLIKTNTNGDTIWTRTYGGSELDEARSIAVTPDGYYIIAGITHSYGSGNGDVYLIKTNTNGDTIWTRTYGGSELDEARSIAVTSDGYYIIAGITHSYTPDNSSRIYILKVSNTGETVWERSDYDPAVTGDLANFIQESDSGYYFVCGGHTNSDMANCFIIDTDGDTIVGVEFWPGQLLSGCYLQNSVYAFTGWFGHKYDPKNWDIGFATVKPGYYSNSKRLGYAHLSESATNFTETIYKTLYIVGNTETYRGDIDIEVFKLDSLGNILFDKTYGFEGVNDFAYAVVGDEDGGCTISGKTGTDLYAFKIDSLGNIVWEEVWGGQGDEAATSIDKTGNNMYVLSGYTSSYGHGGYDVLAMGLNVTSFVSETQNEELYIPFSVHNREWRELEIKYNLYSDQAIQINVYNIMGQRIKSLVNTYQNAGPHTIYWDYTDKNHNPIPQGIYFVELKTPKFNRTKEVIYIDIRN